MRGSDQSSITGVGLNSVRARVLGTTILQVAISPTERVEGVIGTTITSTQEVSVVLLHRDVAVSSLGRGCARRIGKGVRVGVIVMRPVLVRGLVKRVVVVEVGSVLIRTRMPSSKLSMRSKGIELVTDQD